MQTATTIQAEQLAAPASVDPATPLYVDAHGYRSWVTRSGCLEPVFHVVATDGPLSPLWQLLASRLDHRHVQMTGGRWIVTDRGLARLNAALAPSAQVRAA